MAIANIVNMVHRTFTRPIRYGDVAPEGLALGHASFAGDASGGGITIQFNVSGGRLYRAEVVMGRIPTPDIAEDWKIITSHEWATQASGFGTGAFDIDWQLTRDVSAPFIRYNMIRDNYSMLRRFPIGRTDVPTSITIALVTIPTNTNLREYDFDFVCTYWSKRSTVFPGFLQAYWGGGESGGGEVSPPFS